MITMLMSALMVLVDGLVAFPVAWVLMKAWGCVAWEFNLPEFGYWACFFISWVLLIFKPSVTVNKKDD